MSWKDESESNIRYCLGTKSWSWFKDSPQYRTLDTIDGEPLEFEWNIFPGFTSIAAHPRSPKLREQQWANPNNSKDELSSCRCSTTSSWRNKDNEKECIANATLVTLFAKRFPAGRWSFLGLGTEIKWYSTKKERPGGKWDRVAEFDDDQVRRKRISSFPSHESVVSRNAQKQRRWKIICTLLCQW